MAAANPAHAGDLFGPEYAGMVGNVALFIGVGIGAVSALFLPIICGTLNPVQMAINLGIVEGEVSNLRKFKRNGEPMEHGTKFGHTWYNTVLTATGSTSTSQEPRKLLPSRRSKRMTDNRVVSKYCARASKVERRWTSGSEMRR